MSEEGISVVLSRGRTIALAVCVGGGDYSTITTYRARLISQP
jgi:hypothetical protein